MKKLSIYNIAQAILKRNSVQFDQNVAWNEEDAWPYWYPLIPSPFEETDVENGGLGLIGFEIEPSEIKDISIKTDRDSPFRFINTKYVINQCIVDCPDSLAGTITVTAGNVTIPASANIFAATDVGRKICWLNDNGIEETGIIVLFNAANSVDIDVAPIASAAALTVITISSPGTVTVTAGSQAVVGDAQTTFLTTYSGIDGTGDVANNKPSRFSWVDTAGLQRCSMILTVTDDQNIVLAQAPAFGGAVVAHSPTKWVWWSIIGGAAPRPQIPITFEDVWTPLTRFLKVKLNIPSLKNIDFYGDNQYQSASGLTAHRTPIDVLQGEKDGNPMLKSPDALVPTEGTMTYQFENIHTQPIFINAVAFGYKISLEADVGE